jgi:phage-related minor tail protein
VESILQSIGSIFVPLQLPEPCRSNAATSRPKPIIEQLKTIRANRRKGLGREPDRGGVDRDADGVAPDARRPILATGTWNVHTSSMTLKNAALLALIGMLLLTILLIVGFISDVLNVTRGLIPAMTMLSSLIHSFAALAVTVFFYVFHRTQS